MTENKITTITGTVINHNVRLTFTEMCQAMNTQPTLITQLVEYRIIEPIGESENDWEFDHLCLKRARIARNFYHDLEVNLPGIALALDMLEKIDELEAELARLK